MNTSQFINYIKILDDSNKRERDVGDLDRQMVSYFTIVKFDSFDDDTIVRFIKAHPDLFFKNEVLMRWANKRGDVVTSLINTYRAAYDDILLYLSGLMLHYKLSPKSNYKSQSSVPPGSIFNALRPSEFAKGCHKLFTYLYFVSEFRFLHYVSNYTSKRIVDHGYIKMFKGLFINFEKRIEYEMELFCKANRVAEIKDILDEIANVFNEVDNSSLYKRTVAFIRNLGECNSERLSEVKSPVVKKYTYLKGPSDILGAFERASEIDDSNTVYTKIYDALSTTRDQLLKTTRFNLQIDLTDFILFNYLHPHIEIENILVTYYKDTIDIKCIRERCKGSKRTEKWLKRLQLK